MIDKNTFGDSPAAIYLANRLNELGSKKFTRKISSRVHEVQTMLSEIIEAHNMSAISTKTFSYMVFALEMKVDNSAKALMAELEYENSNVPDKLAVDLMLNVVRGGLKKARRQAQKVKGLERSQQAIILQSKIELANNDDIRKNGVLIANKLVKPVKIKLAQMRDEINSSTLLEKSKKKLVKRGKGCTFY